MGINKQYTRGMIAAAIVVLLFIVSGGIWAVNALVRHERQRDIDAWQTTLNVMADSRATRVQRWIGAQFAILTDVAANGSLQIYTQQLQRLPQGQGSTEPAQLSYLHNLILDTARRHDFVAAQDTKAAIPANVVHLADAGLALLARKDMAQISATPGLPVLDKELRQAAAEVMSSGSARLHDIFLDDKGRPLLAFLVPVFALQGPDSGREVVGVLVAIKNAATTLFPLLAAEATVTATDEAILVRREQNLVLYVSPLADGTKPLTRSLPVAAGNLAAAYAVNHPGSFAQRLDYAGREVLFTSRALPGLPWILVQKISAGEALRESRRHQRFLYSALLMTLGLIAALLLAAWFYGSRVKERQVAAELKDRAQQLAAQSHLLGAINDNIGDYIFLVRPDGRLIFINQAFAAVLGLAADEASGKTLVSTLGLAAAKQFMALMADAVAQGQPIMRELAMEINGRSMQLHASGLAFPYLTADQDAVLVSLHDVTQLQAARARKELLLTQIVQALMRAIDLHDPYSANHSAKTTTIAMAVGKRLDLAASSMQVIETAANLCNIGKLFVDREVLAKSDPLAEAEQAALRQEHEFAAKILDGIDFEGPVLATIIQKNELLDGSGHPAGLSGAAIIPTARVLAVANAFVAMVSPRAYRETLSVKEAMAQLLAAVDQRYDRQVVAALFQVAENEIDWRAWPAAGK